MRDTHTVVLAYFSHSSFISLGKSTVSWK